jgi:hypothetical protein
VEIAATDDPATGLLMVGRTCPDVDLLGPVQGRMSTAAFLEAVREAEPELPIVVGVTPDEPTLAGHAALIGAAVLAHPYSTDKLLRLLSSLTSSRRPLEIKPLRLELGRLSWATSGSNGNAASPPPACAASAATTVGDHTGPSAFSHHAPRPRP